MCKYTAIADFNINFSGQCLPGYVIVRVCVCVSCVCVCACVCVWGGGGCGGGGRGSYHGLDIVMFCPSCMIISMI